MGSKVNREQKLLLFLSKNQDYVTAEDLAQILHASKKTVYRLIKKINDKSLYDSLNVSELIHSQQVKCHGKKRQHVKG